MFSRFWIFFEKYERRISSAGLIGGFILDNLTLRRIDLLFENLVFLSYIFVAAVCIVILGFIEANKIRPSWSPRIHTVSLLALQFAFGGLFSGFFIFYSRSGSLAASWPFLFVLLGLLIGNELFKNRYAKFTFRMSVFFVILMSFAIFAVPILARNLSPGIFLLSGAMSVMVMAGFVYVVTSLLPIFQPHIKFLQWSVGAIYLSVTLMYFTNILPPIPLSLKDAGVFHDLRPLGASYVAVRETHPWYTFLRRYEEVHREVGEPVYAFSAIFAPTRIDTTVVHEWQYDDPEDGWITVSRIPFAISGGRDGGYRGYTLKRSLQPGKWRVNIETQRGQLIGRIKFKIIPEKLQEPLETVTL